MSYIEVEYPKEQTAFYEMLEKQLMIYTDGEENQMAVLANASSVLAQAFEQINWVGFYLVEESEKDKPEEEQHLVLGPFQGKPAVSRIQYGNGVCGSAWQRRESLVVKEVACFIGHIACDCNTHSEMVVLMKEKESGKIWGLLDMDSTAVGRFSEDDKTAMEKILPLLER